jgi:hypothetical protein
MPSGSPLIQTLGVTEQAPSSPGPDGSPKWARLCHYPFAFHELMVIEQRTLLLLASRCCGQVLQGAASQWRFLHVALSRLRTRGSGIGLWRGEPYAPGPGLRLAPLRHAGQGFPIGGFGGTAVGLRLVPPNPSFKRTPNGVARQPSSAGASPHCALAVWRATPPGSA